MEASSRHRRVLPLILGIVVSGAILPLLGQDTREERLRNIRSEIARLERELQGLQSRERGVLGELARLEARERLRKAQLSEVNVRLEAVSVEVDRRDAALEALSQAQARRRAYLAFRLRELYKRGPMSELRRVVGGEGLPVYLRGLRYAALLSERDGRALRALRRDRSTIETDRRTLAEERARLRDVRAEAVEASTRLARSRAARGRLLERIRDDRRQREEALAELERASAELSRLVERLDRPRAGPSIDVRKLRGLLDWPAEGKVTGEFGNVVHPRFKTVVPHPGLDIDAGPGDPFRTVFDGTVVYASWLHGYGLTVIVDHGHGVMSVYAHASAVLVEEGEEVLRGEMLGQVGESGSLRGPYLYFEMREAGKPVAPRTWLRPR